jgi:hypothetical protein
MPLMLIAVAKRYTLKVHVVGSHVTVNARLSIPNLDPKYVFLP